MPNTYLTPEEVVDRVTQEARKVVAEMPIEAVRKLGSSDGYLNPGIGGGLLAALIVAAWERLSANPEERKLP